MKLYYAQNTRAVRVAWLLEELALDYEIEKFELGSPEMRAPEYRKIHPMGRVPVLEDGEIRLFESGAIVQYILALYGNGRLQPDVGTQEFAAYLQWFHYCEGMIMPPINTLVVETILLPPERRTEVNVKRATKLLNQMLTTVEQQMEGCAYLAGDFTAADIMTGHSVTVSRDMLGMDFSDKPNLNAYADRLLARPALQKARNL
ncbi:glutathione S-transferase family protein [Antarcticimicrobium sediminis]|uniref:Glutathione S-transferase family protein n=1 Tax=Antarcticimicrobium sediminis TaxID=2546227 RepID=A0A4R5EJ05_9RHOB|nr:glutathione S-transferase family protein [Antarcticimicrobium sediminis]TDE34545.1 glutathione S-transferase family protein [Antarcticimicrobium sediminis]